MPVKKLTEELPFPSASLKKQNFKSFLMNFLKWVFFSTVIGITVGSASALFLTSLNRVTDFRESHLWIIAFLPLAGLAIGFGYHYWGKDIVKGNNLLIEELQSPRQVIPFIMAPLIFAGTIITHLFGGSAGREGTAVQIGGAFADQLTKVFKLQPPDRKIILICGISAGFASVFGTPLAGAIFGLEVFVLGRLMYSGILPALITAIIADYACKAWGVGHTHYSIVLVPQMGVINMMLALSAGIVFGLVARSFSILNHLFSRAFTCIKYPPFRPFIGGLILIVIIYFLGNTKYIGLGIPAISASFTHQEPYYSFVIKLFLTALTLGCGFKGGEVTPLFFIGATLGSFLSFYVPLPVGLLAGMGFVAVFSGAANTPFACIIMGIELFGIDAAIFIALACIAAYLFSGHTGIYRSQKIASFQRFRIKKHQFLG